MYLSDSMPKIKPAQYSGRTGALRTGKKLRGKNALPGNFSVESAGLVKRGLAIAREGKLVPTAVIPHKIVELRRAQLYRRFDPEVVDNMVVSELRANHELEEKEAQRIVEDKLIEKEREAEDRAAAEKGTLSRLLSPKIGGPIRLAGLLASYRASTHPPLSEKEALIRIAKDMRAQAAKKAK